HSTHSLDHPASPSFPTRRSSDLRIVAFEFNAEILTWQGSRAINCPAIRRLRRREVPYRGLVYVRSIASEGKSPAGTWRDSKAIPDRKSTRLNSSHVKNSYAVFCV